MEVVCDVNDPKWHHHSEGVQGGHHSQLASSKSLWADFRKEDGNIEEREKLFFLFFSSRLHSGGKCTREGDSSLLPLKLPSVGRGSLEEANNNFENE